ncbi:hypothetical protein LIER_09226 [Lithospermum erythrorhizon]|uniref:Uncharacterized protein n=1 Tax=Lithospermum erythrorhizon TaxID=34254 RepID=A0AAV3PH52_LITER
METTSGTINGLEGRRGVILTKKPLKLVRNMSCTIQQASEVGKGHLDRKSPKPVKVQSCNTQQAPKEKRGLCHLQNRHAMWSGQCHLPNRITLLKPLRWSYTLKTSLCHQGPWIANPDQIQGYTMQNLGTWGLKSSWKQWNTSHPLRAGICSWISPSTGSENPITYSGSE